MRARKQQDDIDKILSHENDETPMYFVNWYEAMQFCKKLTDQERAAGRLPAGYEYTLPTEAQWEYACRAGTTGAIYGASTDAVAWYGANSYKLKFNYKYTNDISILKLNFLSLSDHDST
jgi:formylglycine-generating enzyme required for sulfatase activity